MSVSFTGGEPKQGETLGGGRVTVQLVDSKCEPLDNAAYIEMTRVVVTKWDQKTAQAELAIDTTLTNTAPRWSSNR